MQSIKQLRTKLNRKCEELEKLKNLYIKQEFKISKLEKQLSKTVPLSAETNHSLFCDEHKKLLSKNVPTDFLVSRMLFLEEDKKELHKDFFSNEWLKENGYVIHDNAWSNRVKNIKELLKLPDEEIKSELKSLLSDKEVVEPTASEKFKKGQKLAEDVTTKLKELQPNYIGNILEDYQSWISSYLTKGGDVKDSAANFKKEVVEPSTTSCSKLSCIGGKCCCNMTTQEAVLYLLKLTSKEKKEVVEPSTTSEKPAFVDVASEAVDIILEGFGYIDRKLVGGIRFQSIDAVTDEFTIKFVAKKEIVDAPAFRFTPDVKFKVPKGMEQLIKTSKGVSQFLSGLMYTFPDGLLGGIVHDEELWNPLNMPEVSIYEAIPELVPDGMKWDVEKGELVKKTCSNQMCQGYVCACDDEAIAHNFVESMNDPEQFEVNLSKMAHKTKDEPILALVAKYGFSYEVTEYVLSAFGEHETKVVLTICSNHNINPMSLKKS